jgi:hypothetical protein
MGSLGWLGSWLTTRQVRSDKCSVLGSDVSIMYLGLCLCHNSLYVPLPQTTLSLIWASKHWWDRRMLPFGLWISGVLHTPHLLSFSLSMKATKGVRQTYDLSDLEKSIQSWWLEYVLGWRWLCHMDSLTRMGNRYQSHELTFEACRPHCSSVKWVKTDLNCTVTSFQWMKASILSCRDWRKMVPVPQNLPSSP